MLYALIFNLFFACLTPIIISENDFFFSHKKKSGQNSKAQDTAGASEAEWLGVPEELRGGR